MTLPEELRAQIETEMNAIPHGWTTVARGIELAELVLEHRPKVLVELGVYGAKSFIPMALAIRHAGCGTAYGIDPYRTEPCLEGENEANKGWWSTIDLEAIQKEVVDRIWKLGLEQIAIIIRARSQDVPQLFPEIGFLSIDANHSEIASCRDAETWVPRVTSGGIVACDDCDWPTTQKMQEIILQSCELLKSGDNGHYKIFRKL